jgi:methionine-rich copper-binding protein CopC
LRPLIPRAAIVLIAVLTVTRSALAHAVLAESSPKNDAVLPAAPSEATLRFNAHIERQVFQAILVAGDGHKTTLTPKQNTTDPPDQVTIPLPALRPGAYQLQYRVLATDGHATPGLIRFTISAQPPATRSAP